jgi:hypothetical protein
MKYIFFTYDGSGLSIAKKLIDEGQTVIVAQIQNASELHSGKTEEAEDRKKRLSVFNGMVPKHDAREVLRRMKNMRGKDDWFVIFDLNSLWYYAQIAVKLGFTNGFFPTEEDTLFEDDREKGKELVKQFWPDLAVAEVQEFKTIEEGIAFLEQSDEMYVLKANTEGDLTVVPKGDDPEQSDEALIGALKTNKAEYEKEGYILEMMIPDPIEITPQMVFYNGKPVFTDIDIENKPIGAGSIGNMTGCAGNLIIQTKMGEKINKIAFPKKVYEMAAQHPGLFIWDASILIDRRTKQLYFGEFCPNRWGYDAIFTELAMADSVASYFESVVAGKNPLKKKFGAAVRVFNIKKFEDTDVTVTDEEGIFFYDVKQEGDHLVTVGSDWNLFVATGAADTIEAAVDQAFDRINPDMFTDGYYRPKFDFNSYDYPNSIPNRYQFANGMLFNAPEWTHPFDRAAVTRGLDSVFQALDQRDEKAKATQKDHEAALAALGEEKDAEIARVREEKEQEIGGIKQQMEDILNS